MKRNENCVSTDLTGKVRVEKEKIIIIQEKESPFF